MQHVSSHLLTCEKMQIKRQQRTHCWFSLAFVVFAVCGMYSMRANESAYNTHHVHDERRIYCKYEAPISLFLSLTHKHTQHVRCGISFWQKIVPKKICDCNVSQWITRTHTYTRADSTMCLWAASANEATTHVIMTNKIFEQMKSNVLQSQKCFQTMYSHLSTIIFYNFHLSSCRLEISVM